jgi:hypothetical protein
MNYIAVSIVSLCLFPNFLHAEQLSTSFVGHYPRNLHIYSFYDYSFSRSEGLQKNSSPIDVQDTLFPTGGYTLAPQQLDSSRHDSKLLVSINEDMQFLLILPYISNEMTVRNKDVGVDQTYITKSSGIGDVSVAGLFDPFDLRDQNMTAKISLGLPTGSIDKTDNTPLSNAYPLPYDMQLGSGSFQISPLFVYWGRDGFISYEIAAGSTFYLNNNDNGYKYGNEYYTGALVSCDIISNCLDVTVSLNSVYSEKIDGRDNRSNSNNDLSHDPGNTGGYRLDCNLKFTIVSFTNLYFSLPAYHSYNGIQLVKQWEAGIMIAIPLYFDI